MSQIVYKKKYVVSFNVMYQVQNMHAAESKVRKKLKLKDSSDQPIYEIPPEKYAAESIIKILLDPTEGKICHAKPSLVSSSATYVVNTKSLQNLEDIKKDDFGIWKYSGSHPLVFKVYHQDDNKIIERCAEGASGSNIVYLRRLHCTHPSNNSFKRMICFLSGKELFVHVNIEFSRMFLILIAFN